MKETVLKVPIQKNTIVVDDSGQHWAFTGRDWKKVQRNVKRRVEARLFMDDKGQVRGWTSDWLTNELATEMQTYFVRWLSQKMVTQVHVSMEEERKRNILHDKSFLPMDDELFFP